MKEPSEIATLNTQKIYVRGTTQSGCHVYMPINDLSNEAQENARRNLQNFLDSQPGPEIPNPEVA